MDKISMIGLDLAKGVFQVHCVAASGEVVLRRQLRRAQVLTFFAKLAPCLVAMEACATAHYWGRELGALGHEVRLMPPAYVKPFVKRGRKNDAVDAAAICDAMKSKGMTFVPVKTVEQQAGLALHRARRLLVCQRTMLANAVRSHLAEFGIVDAQGAAGMARLLTLAVDADDLALPQAVREALAMLAVQLKDCGDKIAALDREIVAWHKADDASRRVATIPGIGPLIASALVTSIGDPTRFKSGRHLAAWLGLVPSQHSSGGKITLGPITKMGDRYLRSLLVIGATSVLRRRASETEGWLARLMASKPRRMVTVALANKMARMVWAILVKGEDYRPMAKASA